jgi:hypothetical protein
MGGSLWMRAVGSSANGCNQLTNGPDIHAAPCDALVWVMGYFIIGLHTVLGRPVALGHKHEKGTGGGAAMTMHS